MLRRASADRSYSVSSRASSAAAAATGSAPPSICVELGLGSIAPVEKLVEALDVESPPEIGDQVETLLDGLDPGRVGLEARDEPVQIAPDLAQSERQLAELCCRPVELGSEARQRCQGPLGGGGERRGAFTVFGGDRGGRCRGTEGELGGVAHPLALGAE